MVIYMDQYREAKAAKLAAMHCCDQEKLCVNWNSAVSVIGMSSGRDPKELSPQFPEDFSKVDVPAFRNRVYALASQI